MHCLRHCMVCELSEGLHHISAVIVLQHAVVAAWAYSMPQAHEARDLSGLQYSWDGQYVEHVHAIHRSCAIVMHGLALLHD